MEDRACWRVAHVSEVLITEHGCRAAGVSTVLVGTQWESQSESWGSSKKVFEVHSDALTSEQGMSRQYTGSYFPRITMAGKNAQFANVALRALYPMGKLPVVSGLVPSTRLMSVLIGVRDRVRAVLRLHRDR